MTGSTGRMSRVSRVLLDLHSAGDVSSLLQAASAGVECCVGCDGAMLSLARDPVAGDIRHFGSMAPEVGRVLRTVDARVAEQNPIYIDRLRLRTEGPSTLDTGDHRRVVEGTDFAAQVLKPLRARRVLHWLNVSPFPVTLMLTRGRGDDFNGEDIEAVRVIGDHIAMRLNTLCRGRNMRALPAGELFPIRRQLWLVTDRSGQILRAQPEAIALLRDCGVECGIGQRLPADMRRALTRRLRGSSREVLRFQPSGRLVAVFLAPIRTVEHECTCTLIEQPLMVEPDGRFVHKGLTRRESEVLHWMCEGKTNVEIGIILDISALTAKKHVENILHKFGVETRTAAVARALEG